MTKEQAEEAARELEMDAVAYAAMATEEGKEPEEVESCERLALRYRRAAHALRTHTPLVEALEVAAFTLRFPENIVECRRCHAPAESHRAETCEVAAALALARKEP